MGLPLATYIWAFRVVPVSIIAAATIVFFMDIIVDFKPSILQVICIN
jgi:hypothetical protein